MDAVTQLQVSVASLADLYGALLSHTESSARLTPAQARALAALASSDGESTGPTFRADDGTLITPLAPSGVGPYLDYASTAMAMSADTAALTAEIHVLIDKLPETFPLPSSSSTSSSAAPTAGSSTPFMEAAANARRASRRLRKAEKRAQYYQGLLRARTSEVAGVLWGLDGEGKGGKGARQGK